MAVFHPVVALTISMPVVIVELAALAGHSQFALI
jgi:hypothetical protein